MKSPAKPPRPPKQKPLTAEDIRKYAVWRPLYPSELRLIEELERAEQEQRRAEPPQGS